MVLLEYNSAVAIGQFTDGSRHLATGRPKYLVTGMTPGQEPHHSAEFVPYLSYVQLWRAACVRARTDREPTKRRAAHADERDPVTEAV